MCFVTTKRIGSIYIIMKKSLQSGCAELDQRKKHSLGHNFLFFAFFFQFCVCFFGNKRIDFGGYFVAGSRLLHLVAYKKGEKSMLERFSISGLGNMFRKVLPALLVTLGVFSSMADAACSGTLYFKKPAGWTGAYVVYEQTTYPITQQDGSWYTFNLNQATGKGWNRAGFAIAADNDLWNTAGMITGKVWDLPGNVGNTEDASAIACPGAGATVYVEENPLQPGTTRVGDNPSGAYFVYVLVPDDKEWQSDFMMIEIDGAPGVQMTASTELCGWYQMAFENPPNNVLFYRKNDPSTKLGQQGLWGDVSNPAPLPLKAILDGFGTKALYFIPDDAQWPDGREADQGLFVDDPGVSGICSFELAAVIYDTDCSVNNVFSLYHGDGGEAVRSCPESPRVTTCQGVKTGVVKEDLDPTTRKPVLNAGSTNADACFTQDEFNTLFNSVPGVNEVVCYDLPFSRAKDGRWTFDSDQQITAGLKGGFSPRENPTDAEVTKTGISTTMCPACRTKSRADGPAPASLKTTLVGNLDSLCRGPGWDGGVVDCNGLFVTGDAYVDYNWDARWKDGLRNQFFCFESHATFTYSEDQVFAFRGDDDIWVFINNKLVVDNGGAHQAAPGLVVLKTLNAKWGPTFMVPGNDYPLDIFFCDRRTTQSNVIIKTNMFIKQTSGLTASGEKQSDGTTKYNMCYERSGDGTCASVALGQSGGGDGTVSECGAGIKTYGDLRYSITTRAGEKKGELTSGQAGYQWGGINIEDPFNPIINAEKINGLPPGSYRLVIDFFDKQKNALDTTARTYISFRIKGNLDVMTQTSVYTVNAGDEKSDFYDNGAKWEFVGEGLAGSRVPVYVSAFADGGVDLLGAVGQTYSLVLDKGMTAYTSETGDGVVSWPRSIGPSGIDTVWVYQGLDGLTTNPEEKTVSLKSQAKIKFYAPRLDFAEPEIVDSTGRVTKWNYPLAGDPDSLDGDEYFHWIGSDVDLYVLIVNPVNNQICKNCVLSLELKDYSTGLSMPNESIYLGDGAYIISIRSRKEYMDTTAYITIGSSDDVNNLSLSSYVNMRFRKPPVPYPQLVDIFDARGTGLGALSIIEPYYSKSKEYLDGKADSIAIYYDRPFVPNPQGEYKDSLPFLICLDWDDNQFDEYNFATMKSFGKDPGPADTLVFSKTKKDTAVACSYMIDSVSIYKAFETRFKANGNKSDSVLTFAAPADSAFSVGVKTVGRGKVLNFATYEDRKKVTKGHFDGSVTDRIAPVIVSARIENSSDDINRLTVQLSEPMKLLDSSYKMAPFTFYMNSATDVSDTKKYASSEARREPTGVGTDKIIVLYDKTQGAKNPTPRVGDYIRLRADSWMWSDTVNTKSDVARSSGDADMHWNSPTDYNSSKRLPSAWVSILGEYSAEVSAIKLASINKDLPPNTPAVEPFIIPTTFNKDSIMARYPGTLGFIVQSDIAAFINGDEKIDSCFNANPDALEDVYFQYEVQYFTNLGSYVAGDKQKIYCKDPKFFGEGKTCREVHGNFYIAWNMLSDKKRLVGTGAYIAKLKSFVNLGDKCADGKVKASKVEETDMWGAKRGKGVIKK